MSHTERLSQRRGARARAVDLLLVLGGAWLLAHGRPGGLPALSAGLLLLVAASRPGWLTPPGELSPERVPRHAAAWSAIGAAYAGVAAYLLLDGAAERPWSATLIAAGVHACVALVPFTIASAYARAALR